MAVVQDIYNAAPATGFPGMVANGETSNRISRTVEDAAGLGFGKPAFAGADDRGCTGTVKTADDFLGFVIADHGQPVLPGGVGPDIVPRYQSAGILVLGAIDVVAQGAVTDRAPVFIDAATGGVTATANGNIATGFRFDDTAGNGAIVRVVRR